MSADAESRRRPIIDEHPHAIAMYFQGPPPQTTCAPFSEFPAWDTSTGYPKQFGSYGDQPDGEARFLIGDEYFDFAAGDVGVVPPDTLHHWMALNDQPVRVRAIFDPSLDISAWFLHFQKHIAAGDMNLLLAAVFAREYPDSSPMPASPPPAVWNLVSRVLAPIGRFLGYEAC